MMGGGFDWRRNIGRQEQIVRDLRHACRSLLDDQGRLQSVASRSYSHPLGYDKIVLCQESSGARVRLHLWSQDGPNFSSDIHDHYWNFQSLVIFGTITFREYESGANRGVPHVRYRMEPLGSGAHVLKFDGKGPLSLCREVQVSQGGRYELDSTVLHSAHCAEPTLTLVVQEPPTQTHNTVYKFEGPESDIERRSVPPLSMAQLAGAIQHVLSRLPN